VRSYKLRGACNLRVQEHPKRLKHGAVRASAGNHGRSAALAGARLGVRTRVYLPRMTPRQKRDRIAVLGGYTVAVDLFGDTYDEAADAARTRWSAPARSTSSRSTLRRRSPGRRGPCTWLAPIRRAQGVLLAPPGCSCCSG
jgi:cysteine synthase